MRLIWGGSRWITNSISRPWQWRPIWYSWLPGTIYIRWGYWWWYLYIKDSK